MPLVLMNVWENKYDWKSSETVAWDQPHSQIVSYEDVLLDFILDSVDTTNMFR
jgi:hypothetical protein